ncbi:MAG TPA: aldehyde dehydrogenase family protein [Pyrinomonadaceae bacterium]|jgi:succinate-semialdehyde dehydrogenase/glutarate-semialdehyde dehydrogenase|nr:aldehyde dehydrogenase family protein [Pyrinomonadaceae bacterium]
MSVQILPAQEKKASEIISYDPGTGAEIGRAPLFSPEGVKAAVNAARIAQPAWASLSFHQRGRVILEARKIMLAERDELALLVSKETGKPVAEATSMEIVPTLDAMHYFATYSDHLLRPQPIDIGQYGLMGRSSRIVFRPLGVIGIISPWNFPLATPADEVVMALMAGNAVVLKPSELTPLIALKLAEVFKRAGLPSGLLNIATGDGSTGQALIDARVDKIMFTGSVATGKRVAEAAAKYLTPVVLELGGKDPMIVLADADIKNAARGAVWGAFANSGQACASVERCYVQESIASKFIEQVVTETRALKQGLGTESGIDVGAMSNENQLRIVSDHVNDARERGAQILTGGQRGPNPDGLFYEPTVLINVNHDMAIMRDETFGPVLPIMTFKTEAEALELANDSIFGLTASVWTRNIAKGKRMAEQIDAGTVMVNEVVYTHGIAQTPWGGVKDSGYGKTHGRMGLLELVHAQHIHVNRFSFLPDLWWFRYSPRAGRLFGGLANNFTTGSILKTSLLLPQMIRRLFGRRE